VAPSDSDEIDFKPFFDMIVGVLFVLLILIAAQMFFTQWGADPEDAARRERQAQAQIDWERQLTGFLEDVRQRVAAAGLPAAADVTQRTVSVPLSALAAPSPGAPRIDAGAAGRLGQAVLASLRCLAGQGSAPAAREPGCPATYRLRLWQVGTELRLAGAPQGTDLPPDRAGALLGALVTAALLQGAPELLGVSGTSGLPALARAPATSLAPAASPAPTATPAAPDGAWLFQFRFEAPDGMGRDAFISPP
jgi:hypothetical protein